MITSISSPPARHDLKIFSLILDFDLLFYMFIYDMIIRCKPIELILTWIPAAISLVMLILGKYNSFLLIIYAICWFYPIYIFAFQFKNSVSYHLKHRDASEDAPCTITLMDSAILADIPDHDLVYTYEWEQFTTVYFLYGYYMLFNGSKMIVMLNTNDMPDDVKSNAGQFIKEHVDLNKCKIAY